MTDLERRREMWGGSLRSCSGSNHRITLASFIYLQLHLTMRKSKNECNPNPFGGAGVKFTDESQRGNICKPSRGNEPRTTGSSKKKKKKGLIGLFREVVVCCSCYVNRYLCCARRKPRLWRIISLSKSPCSPGGRIKVESVSQWAKSLASSVDLAVLPSQKSACCPLLLEVRMLENKATAEQISTQRSRSKPELRSNPPIWPENT